MLGIGCDHGGFALKEELKAHLEERGLEVKDYGIYEEASCDYPDIAKKVADAVVSGECERAILVCGTGIGMSIAANKVPGIRAAVVSDCFSAKLTRQHNDANILCLGGRVVGAGLARLIVDSYLDADFEGGRHKGRIDKITALENN